MTPPITDAPNAIESIAHRYMIIGVQKQCISQHRPTINRISHHRTPLFLFEE
jgi:hypothetical protein